MVSRRSVVGLSVALSTCLALGQAAAQSGYPEQSVRILVGFTPGVAPDVSPAELAAVIQRELPQWARVIKQAGIKASE